MRLCFIVDSNSIHSRKWAGYFVERGHDVHVLSTGETGIPGAKFHRLFNRWPPKVRFLPRLAKVRRLVAKIKPDLINGQPLGLGFYALLSGARPATAGAWGSDVYVTGRSRLGKWHTRFVLRNADLLTADSKDLKDEMVRQGADPSKVMLVTHGVDSKKFKPGGVEPLKKRLGLKGKKIVLAARYFEPPYDLQGIAEAFPQVLREVPDAVLVYVGKGSLERELRALVKRLGIEKRVVFLPPVNYSDFPGYLKLADAYVSASVYESTSISLLEAMSCGLAPVVSDLESNLEWIRDGRNGLVFERRNRAQMAEKIVYALRHPQKMRAFGRINRRLIREKAEYGREMRKVERSYEALVAKYKGKRGSKSPGKREGGRRGK
ncbi:hypothetical protein AUJ16_00800 [Candidatus Micrarchaeota archaeon CG1_02_60_51]|nr:MAG: hypothetical protein AUJ16_00800 [Candidatus Micrarchaeota archaeon CG1_02_60_51]